MSKPGQPNINEIINKFDLSKEPAVLKNLPINYATLHDAYRDKKWELGDEKVVLGDYEADGYKMIYANLKKGQDAFGISLDRKTFCVTDGMGAEGIYSGDIARYLSAELTNTNSSWKQAFTEGGIQSLVETFVTNWKKNNSNVDIRDFSGETTLSICRIHDDGSIKILQLGDSPVYIKTKNGQLISYGNDNLNNTSTGMDIGVQEGKLIMNFDLQKNIHTAKDVDAVVLASDWMSDNYESLTMEANEKWIAKWEGVYPDLKTGNSKALSVLVNEYNLRVAIRKNLKPFDLLAFKAIGSESDIIEKMAKRYEKKFDDITIAMVNVNKILNKK